MGKLKIARCSASQLAYDGVRMLPTTVVRGKANPRHWKCPDRLRRARQAAGLTADALSKAAGVGEASVSMIEAGKRTPRLPMLERIANALRLAPSFIAYGIEAPWEPAEGLRCDGLAARAHEVRTESGLSQREVDRRAGSAEGTIRIIEADTMPTIATLEALAKGLGVSPAWLAFGAGPRELPKRGSPHARGQIGT